jgi:hypothetical protein
MMRNIPSKEELKEKYEELGSAAKLGEHYHICPTAALNWMKFYNIEINKSLQQISNDKPSKEELEAKCKEIGRSAAKVGEYYKVSKVTALKWMRKYGIETGKKPSKEELKEKYTELGSFVKVGKYYGVDAGTVFNWMKNYGIESNKSTVQISQEKKPSKEELEQKYNQHKSSIKLAEEIGVSHTTVVRWLKEDRIEVRKSDRQISQETKPSKEKLEQVCKEFEYNTIKVGKYYGVCNTTAGKWMKSYGIKINKLNSLEQQIEAYIGKDDKDNEDGTSGLLAPIKGGPDKSGSASKKLGDEQNAYGDGK